MRVIRSTAFACAMVLALTLVGCANKPQTLYAWDGYQKNVDDYLRSDRQGVDTQVQSMEENLKKIRASGAAVPPGYHAHLGLLYGKQGKTAQFAEEMRTEKALFPESSAFVDFLLRNFKK